MAISDLTAAMATALAETKDKLRELDAAISTLEGERFRLLQTMPHTDDLVATFMRGLVKASESFEQRLGWYLNSETLKHGAAAAEAQNTAGQFLMLGAKRPERQLGQGIQLFPHSGLGAHQADIDVAAVTYFLRDKIADEIPAIIEKLCPLAKSGIKQADRERALLDLDGNLAELHAEREGLVSEINAAIKAVSPARLA